MKIVSILGSTGSIGTQAIEVIKGQKIAVAAITGNKNYPLLVEQAKVLKPRLICIYDEFLKETLIRELNKEGLGNIEVVTGDAGLIKAATLDECELILNAVVGMVGLRPTLKAIEKKKDVAIANKETIVIGGELVNKLSRENNVKIIPVDSEHSAIFQSIEDGNKENIKRILLTASGGMFYGKTKKELKSVTPSEAIKNPNWKMGKKVSVDSATLMNKGLELIEATNLFNVNSKDIEVLVHRESVLHSAVEYIDGAVIGQMAVPDMKLAIQYALTYPKRAKSNVASLDLAEIGSLTFKKPDREVFECLKYCEEAAKRGGYYPAFINGANEEAVSLFLEGKISFLDIAKAVKMALNIKPDIEEISLEGIINADKKAKEMVKYQFS